MAARRRPVDPDQLLLDLGDEPMPPVFGATGPVDVFFAAMPTLATARNLAGFGDAAADRFRVSGQRRLARVLHVTLFPLGTYGTLVPDAIAFAQRAAATIDRPRFTVGFDRLASLKHGTAHPPVLLGGDGVAGLEALHRALALALGLAEDPSFLPHMTLLYGSRLPEEVLLEEPLTWSVEEFVLVHSLRGHTKYDVLGRWPLRR